MSSLTPAPILEVELAGVGGGWTNISTDLLSAQSLVITHGIQGSEPSDLVATPSAAQFALNNAADNGHALGYYSLYHASKRSGWALGIGCRIRFVDPATSIARTRFVGRIHVVDPMPGSKGGRSVAVTAVGWLHDASVWALTPDVGQQIGKRGDELLTQILAVMPTQPASTSFDIGHDTYPFALDTGRTGKETALTEFAKVAASGLDLIYEKADGTLRFESRHTRMINTSTDWAITDADLPYGANAVALPSSRDDILNTVRVTTYPRIVDATDETVVYDQANPIFVANGDTQLLIGSYRDPVTLEAIGATDVQPQVSGVDYLANTEAAGSGSNLTSGFTITVSDGPSGAQFLVTNSSGSDGYLTRNQLRGRGVHDRGATSADATDPTSIGLYGEHVFTYDMPYQGDQQVGQAAADFLSSKFKNPLAQVKTVTVFGKSSALLTQLLLRDISDRLTITETVTGANGAFFINGVELTVLPSGHVRATYTLTTAADPYGGAYWLLGTGVLGTSTTLVPF